jgi:ABC-2 type transport system permease protein
MRAPAGTWPLVRLALRRDRIILPVWIVLLSFIPASTAGAYETLYPTAADRASLAAGAARNPSFSLLYGPAFDLTTPGGFTAWRYGGFFVVFLALMSIFTVTRHTRAEEDTGRFELIGSTVVGRYAPLTAAILVTAAANLAISALAALALIGAKLPATGALAFGLTAFAAGLVFTAIAAVTAQLTEFSRTANSIACAVLGATFLLRAVGDSTASAHWLSWLSPIGWAQQVRPFAGERWWVLLLEFGMAALLAGLAYALLPRRDLGAGLFPTRLGSARAPRSLSTALGLGYRLHRGSLLGWGIGFAIVGGLFGSLANGVGDLLGDSQQTREIFERLGGSSKIVDAFLASIAGLCAMVAALYGVQAALRMRGEETAFRAEPVLATGVSRTRWAASHLTFALVGSAALLAVAGLAMGLTHGLRGHDLGGQLPRVLGGTMAQLPAVWVVTGVAVLLFGVLPRLTTVAWAVAMAALLVSMFGPVINLPQGVLDVSPFTHIPKLPGQAFTATPLLWLTGIAVVAVAAGLAGFRRRDVGA